jgi:uncharacterized protein (TIGR03792 family)
VTPLRWRRVPSLIGLLLIQGVTLVLLLTSHASPVRAAFAEPDGAYDVVVVEHLRLKVPAEARQAWIRAEQGSWEPWLAQQQGFLDRQLLWDPATEEGTLLIRWADRDHWKAIPDAEVQAVQERFERLARAATGSSESDGNPFPLVFEGELLTP